MFQKNVVYNTQPCICCKEGSTITFDNGEINVYLTPGQAYLNLPPRTIVRDP